MWRALVAPWGASQVKGTAPASNGSPPMSSAGDAINLVCDPGQVASPLLTNKCATGFTQIREGLMRLDTQQSFARS